MWMVEDALEGRLTVGRDRGAHAGEEYVVRLSGKRMYQLQKFLEEAAAEGGNFFRARMAVMLWEELRRGIMMRGDGEPPSGGEGNE
jgi:hypothetical protein